MTIASSTARIGYVGNGATTAFSVPFYFGANADLIVTVQDLVGTVTTKLLGTDYNLTGATLSAGGTCTFVVAPTLNYIIAITRVPQLTQTASYNNNDPFPAKSHELALDKATTVDQYLKTLIDRAILVPTTDTPPYTTLPAASVRANKALTFDSLGNPSASTPVTGTAVSSVMIPVVSASTLAIARAALFDPASAGANESLTLTAAGTGAINLTSGSGGIQMNGSGLWRMNYGATGHLFIGNGSPSGDDSAVYAGRTLIPASGLLNSHAFRDESVATQNVTASAFSGYSSFDAGPQIIGSATTPMNHIRNFQARTQYNSTGHVNELAGLWVGHVVNNASAVVDQMYGVHVINNQITAGTVSNQYAFYADVLSGATNNYFLFGGNNPSVLNGKLFVGGLLASVAAEISNISYNGSLNQGMLFYDSYASAATLSAVLFYRNTVNIGSITTTLAATAYNTSSDERLKEFTGEYDAAEAIRIIRADPVRTFNWKHTGDAAVGWGAQTSYIVCSDLASPGNDKEPGEEGFQPWGVDQGKRTPYLWAALSNALDRIDDLEKRLAAAGL